MNEYEIYYIDKLSNEGIRTTESGNTIVDALLNFWKEPDMVYYKEKDIEITEIKKVDDKYYYNTQTGEITENHDEAMEWYRSGIEVEIWRNGKRVLSWVY